MQKTFATLNVVVLAFIVMGAAGCSDTDYSYSIERKTVNGLPTVTATETSTAEAKVDAVDYGNRSIALTGPSGKTEIFTVSSAVRNFSQIKKGDTVKVDYSTRIFASVRKTSDMPTTQTISSVALAELGDKPGITCWRKAIVEANVEAINYSTRVVKLRTTTGDLMILTADEKLKDLDKVHVGDQVVFDYTEAVSITVE
jgi:hypothetical protein